MATTLDSVPRSIPPRFEQELRDLLNTYSVDSYVGMHDFVLAQLVTRFLECMSIAHLQEERLGNG